MQLVDLVGVLVADRAATVDQDPQHLTLSIE
jgi:hypothetical protein